MLSQETGKKLFDFLDYKIKLNEFEQWIYDSIELATELKESYYYELISFDFKQKDTFYSMGRIVKDILAKYQCIRSSYITNICIQGICITNRGNYFHMKNQGDRHFMLTVGQSYNILSIDYEKCENGLVYCQYAIIDDEAMIYIIPAELLRVHTIEIPEGWILEEQGSGQLSLEPKEWNSRFYRGEFSFWEDFYDYKEPALFEFIRVLHRMGIEIPERFCAYAIRLLEMS